MTNDIKLYSKKENRILGIKDSFTLKKFDELPKYFKNDLLKEIREEIKNGDDSNYKLIKNGLPCVNVHNNGDIVKKEFESTNLMCFDIDHITQQDITRIKRHNTLYYSSMLSPSGNGIKIFIQVINVTEDNFKPVYTKILNKLNETLNVNCDPSSNDLNRLCFLGTDLDINPEFEPLDANKLITPLDLIKKVNKRQFESTFKYLDIDYYIEQIKALETPFCTSYDELKNIISSFCSLQLTEVEKLEKLTMLFGNTYTSPRNNSYNIELEFNKLQKWYDSDKDNKITIGSFIHLCHKLGIKKQPSTKVYHHLFSKKTEVIEDYITNNLCIKTCRYNNNYLEFDNTISNYRDLNGLDPADFFVKYNDNTISIIMPDKQKENPENETHKELRTDLTPFRASKMEWNSCINLFKKDNQIDTSKILFENLLTKYNDVNGLNEFEKFIQIFAPYCLNETKENIYLKMKTLLKSIVKKGLGNKTEYCGVFLSKKEGFGKTDFCRKFLFKIFNEQHLYKKIKLTDDEWKTNDYLSQCIIGEIDEKGVGMNQSNILKNLVSSNTEQIKDKGSNVVKNKISRSTIIFTTNDNTFLKNLNEDDRRYLIFDFGNQDKNLWFLDESHNIKWVFDNIDFEKVWAEIYADYLKNDRVEIDIENIKKFNKQYKVQVGYENRNNEVLKDFIENVINDEGIKVYMNSSDIVLLMNILFDGSFDLNRTSLDLITKHFKDKETPSKKTLCVTEFRDNLFLNDSYSLSGGRIWENNRSYRFEMKIDPKFVTMLKNVKNYLVLEKYNKKIIF